MDIFNFYLQTKFSERRDSRCKECVEESKRNLRAENSFIKEKLIYESNNKKYGYSLKICKKHGALSYDDIRLRIRYVKGNMQTNLSCIPCIKNHLKRQKNDKFEAHYKLEKIIKCKSCKNKLSIDKFPSSSLKSKYPRCGFCLSETSKKSFRLAKYGISDEHYTKLLILQNNKCKICGNEETAMFGKKTKSLAVDHCHSSMKIRGLLCQTCNTAIGQLNHDINLLTKAIKYLEDND